MKPAAVILFIFCCVAHFSSSAQIQAGYITASQASSNNICTLTNASTQVFTNDGTMANGKTATNAGGTPIVGGWNWYGFSTSNTGTVTHYIQITDGGTVQNYTACGGGGGGGGSGGIAPPLSGYPKLIPFDWFDLTGGTDTSKYALPLELLWDSIPGNGGLPITAYTKVASINHNDDDSLMYPAAPDGSRPGMLYMLDFTGSKVHQNLTRKDTIRRIAILEKSFHRNQAIKFYNFDVAIANPDTVFRNNALSHPQYYLTPLATILVNRGYDSSADGVWRYVDVNQPLRYVLMQLQGKDTVDEYQTPTYAYPNILELRFEGTKFNNQNFAKTDYQSATLAPPNKLLKEYIGVNTGALANDTLYRWDKYVSQYHFNTYKLPSVTPYSSTMKFSADGTFDGETFSNQANRLKIAYGTKTIVSTRGQFNYAATQFAIRKYQTYGPFYASWIPGYMDSANSVAQYRGTYTNKKMPIDSLGADARKPDSYKTKVRYNAAFALKYGSMNLAGYNGADYWENETPFPGYTRGVIYALLDNNETSEYWNGNMIPLATWAVGSNSMKEISKIDTTFLYSPLTTSYMMPNYYRAVWWISNIMAGDTNNIKYPLNLITYHEYPGVTNDYPLQPSLEEYVGATGRTYVADNHLTKTPYYVRMMRSMFGDAVKVVHHEYGISELDVPRSNAFQSGYEPYVTKAIPGKASGEVRAEHLLQSEVLMPFSGIDWYNFFMIHNSVYSQVGEVTDIFTLHGKATGVPGQPNNNAQLGTKYHVYYEAPFREKYLDRFMPDSLKTWSKNAPVVVKYQHPGNDTVAYVAWRDTASNYTAPYNIYVGTNNATAKLVTISYNGLVMTGNETIVPTSNGYVTINSMGYTPAIVYALEPITTPAPPADRLRRRGGKPIRFKKN